MTCKYVMIEEDIEKAQSRGLGGKGTGRTWRMSDMTCKYVMIDNRFPVIFPNFITHSSLRAAAMVEGKKITSAGMIIKDGDKLVCVGESISLKMRPASIDTELVNMLFDGSFDSLAFFVEARKNGISS